MTNTEKWFKASAGWKDEIVAVDVVRHTEKTVTFMEKSWRGDMYSERRSAKISSDTAFFQAWHEARAWLLEKSEYGLESASRSLDKARARHESVKRMKS